MLARLYILLPFQINIPEGEQFTIYEYEDGGYKIRVHPPIRSDKEPSNISPDQLKIDGTPVFQADTLRIDFYKESFNRTESTLDPPMPVINQAINSFLIRLRHVTRASQVHPLDFSLTMSQLQYLNDDGTELEKTEGLIRGRGTMQFKFYMLILNKNIWEDVHKLPPNFEPPPWDSLLLDANAELPSIGAAIVLASTALEVFVSQTLDKLATLKNTPPPELWKWINQRGDWLREPTVAEQYDTLLKFFTGHSLKEEEKLWESFKNLKGARNSFVHEGVAKIGKKNGTPISTETAQQLIHSAADIIAKVKEWLPSDLHWLEFKHNFKVEFTKRLM